MRHWLNFSRQASFISIFPSTLERSIVWQAEWSLQGKRLFSTAKMSVKPRNICHNTQKCSKLFLPTIYVKSHSCSCSISSVIVWDTLVVAIVLRSIDVVEGILTATVLTQDAAIEIELVNWHLRHSSHNFALECNCVSFSDGILRSIGSEPCTFGSV